MKRCYTLTMNTKDCAKTRAFYADTLGLPVLAERPNISVTVDAGSVTLTFESFYKKPESYAEIYLEVEDVPHFCMRLRAAGGSIHREWRDKAELIDPDGRKVVLTEKRYGTEI